METHAAPHPSDDALRAYALGKLDDASADTLRLHLETCANCFKAVAETPGDEFLKKLQAAIPFGGTPLPSKLPAGQVGTFWLTDSPSANQSPPLNLPPELANHPQYEIIRELGKGGMGAVYLARHRLTARQEALKVVNKQLVEQPGTFQRFVREIQAAARLSHPNVVAAYTAFQADSLLVFAMEFVDGQDLQKLVNERGNLPVANACHYVRQAALGLQHAFEKGLVHRDIKPSNLIFLREGKRHTVKVADFGLAKATREASLDMSLTASSQTLGTPLFMAPEQARDAAHADIRADIYSLGCTLYYLLTGAPPFNGRSLYDVMQAHQSTQARPLNRVRPEVPKKLAAVVRKMMAKDPAKRYQTPMALVQALAPFAKPVAKPSSKRKWLIGGGIAGGVLLIGLLGLWAGGVFRVKTPQGTLVVEVNVPNPDVYVDGEKITVSWDKGGKEAQIRVPPGTRKVEVTKDGFAAFGEQVALSDGQRRVLTARLEQQPRVESGQGRPPKAKKAKGAPVDEGSRAGEERDDNALKMKFCWCPTRTIPGSPRSPGIHSQGFQMPGFWMGKYEVTQSEWAGLMGSMPLHALDKGKGDRHPIYYVSHDDATEFCRKLTDLERNAGRLPSGWAYLLPTEVQWEYACRAGTTTATAFGDQLDSTQANFNGDWPYNGAPKGPSLGMAVKVGSYRPNAWGIYDMHGNVGEFTATPGRHRGGSWYDSGRNCGSDIFIPDPPNASEHVGFRVARVRD